MSKLLAGEATFPEQKELEAAFRENPFLRETWNAVMALKEAPPAGLSAKDEQRMLEKGLLRLDRLREDRSGLSVVAPYEEPFAHSPQEQSAIGQEDAYATEVQSQEAEDRPETGPAIGIRRRWGWMVAAASVAILGITGALLYQGHARISAVAAPILSKELVSKYGSRSFIELPDGSKLWLNAGSKVTYADAFADGKRELTLSGEAYFDVKHDAAHPFIIHTGKLDIRVLGTTFNVKAYPGDSLTETTLIRGKVEVDFTNHLHPAIVLQPSEKLIVSTATNKPVPSPATPVAREQTAKIFTAPVIPDSADGTIQETSWVENRLVFRKEPFEQLAMKLQRWYNVKIFFDNEKYRMDELTGAFKDQRIDEVMHALQLTSDFHYRIAGDTIRIW